MRVLMLTPWPLVRPLHGGQLRASEIVRAYRAAGHTVQVIGLYDPRHTAPADHTVEDHPITPEIHEWTLRHNGTPNMGFWQALASAPDSFGRYRVQAERFMPDIVQFEEPFLWPVVAKLRRIGALGPRVRIVHSSYNVEHAWRREYADPAPHEARFSEELEQLEREIARESDAVCAVSEPDAAAFLAMGADRVVVAPNGATRHAAPAQERAALRDYLGGSPFVLLVSSAHPPNARALLKLAHAAPAGSLQAGLLVVCGTIRSLLDPHRGEPELRPFFRRVRLFGRVSDAVLAAAYAEARAVLVPRTGGGGSNLKVAEALVAGGPIVATSRAFIGFEPYARAAGVIIADDPSAFWAAADRALIEDAPETTRSGMDSLLWPNALAPLIRLAESLVC